MQCLPQDPWQQKDFSPASLQAGQEVTRQHTQGLQNSASDHEKLLSIQKE